MSMKPLARRWPALLYISVVLLLPRFAQAHAMLQKSIPEANAVLAGVRDGHLPIELTFNSRIDAQHSSLALLTGGNTIRLKVDGRAAPNLLRSEANAIKPGHYMLQWQVVAGDGHVSRGAIPFTVR